MSRKSELRNAVLARREALAESERRALAARITPRLLGLEAYRDARCVMAYVSFGSEFDTAAFLTDARARGKRIVLPRVDREARALALHRIEDPERDLAPGVFGIREPRPDACVAADPREIDFVLVPGVAFTPRCERLGYGRGYYDRLIASFPRRPALVAAAFGLQIVPELPMAESDRRVDRVVTETGDYRRDAEEIV